MRVARQHPYHLQVTRTNNGKFVVNHNNGVINNHNNNNNNNHIQQYIINDGDGGGGGDGDGDGDGEGDGEGDVEVGIQDGRQINYGINNSSNNNNDDDVNVNINNVNVDDSENSHENNNGNELLLLQQQQQQEQQQQQREQNYLQLRQRQQRQQNQIDRQLQLQLELQHNQLLLLQREQREREEQQRLVLLLQRQQQQQQEQEQREQRLEQRNVVAVNNEDYDRERVRDGDKEEEATVVNTTNNFTSCESVQSINHGPTLLGDRFLLVGPAEGSALIKCVDVKTGQQLVAKALTMGDKGGQDLLEAHLRLDGTGAASGVAGVVDAPRGKRYLLLEGHHGDLHAYVRARRRLREPEARRLFRQAANAVYTCHENGVVLRDLKLRKFVFADEARTKLRLESLEDAVMVENNDDKLADRRGCPAYVAPEVLRSGQAYSGKAADVWSLGVLLYTMLVGRYPFNDAEHATLFAKISRGLFNVPDSLTPRAKCLVKALLRKEPNERPHSQDVIRHPWITKPIYFTQNIINNNNNNSSNSNNSNNNHAANRINSDQLVPIFLSNSSSSSSSSSSLSSFSSQD